MIASFTLAAAWSESTMPSRVGACLVLLEARRAGGAVVAIWQRYSAKRTARKK